MVDEKEIEGLFCFRLAAAIAEMPNPVKDTKAYNYMYETLGQVLDIVQGKLMNHALYVTQGIGYDHDHYELRTVVRDMFDPEVAAVMDIRPLRLVGDPQKDGSAETYARRYALKTVFGLCGADDDGAAASGKNAEPKHGDSLEYQQMVHALNVYCETTGKEKGAAWKQFSEGKQVSEFKDSENLCIRVRKAIEDATKMGGK